MIEPEAHHIEAFLQHLESRGRKAKTLQSYRSAHRSLCAWFMNRDKKPFSWSTITGMDLRQWKVDAMKNGALPTTINHRLIFSRAYAAWLLQKGIIRQEQLDSVDSVKDIQIPQLGARVMEPEEFRRFMRHVELAASKRDRALVHLLLGGLREGEVAGLQHDQLYLTSSKGHVRIIGDHVKGSASRIVPLGRQARMTLIAYLEGRPSTGQVFLGERGPLTEDGIYKIIRRLGEAVGLKVFPHKLRHQFGELYLSENPGDLPGLQTLLGHANVATTARHYARKRLSALEEGVEKIIL